LENVANASGFFLPRGVCLKPLDREKKWTYTPKAKIGEILERGDTIGITMEGRFEHHIMLPFSKFGRFTLTWSIEHGSYHVNTIIAIAKDERGVEHSFSMIQRWPIKFPLFKGERIKPAKMMDTGL